MKSRPILFSGPMVKALLHSGKTQTRRVISPQSPERFTRKPELFPNLGWRWINRDGFYWPPPSKTKACNGLCCPYGQVGDQLWVRETWFCDDFDVQSAPYLETITSKENVYYRADDAKGDITNLIPECDLDWREHIRRDRRADVWKPSIHMPRWASRLTLEITDIRAQRLQEIDKPDAKAEGVEGTPYGAVAEFANLWDSINVARGYGWKTNPWVWAITFKRVEAAA